MLLNKKAVKELVKSKGLRTSKEFFDNLECILRERILRACQRNKSLKRNTLKKDELYM